MGVGLILLTVLKYIGFFLLIILATAILLGALILFMPIKYNARLSYGPELLADVEATWIFRIIKLVFSNNKEAGGYKLLIFNRDWFGRKKKRKQKSKPQKKKTTQKKIDNKNNNGETSDNVDERINNGNAQAYRPNETDEIFSRITDENKSEQKKPKLNEASGNNSNNDKIKESIGQIDEAVTHADPDAANGEKKSGLADKIKSLSDKIRSFVDYPDKKPVIRTVYKLTRRLLSAIKPDKIKIWADIGFDDPYFTGKVIGALACFAGVTGLDIKLSGDFAKPAMDIAAEIKGRIVIWSFVWPLAGFVLTRPVWKLIKPIIFRKDDIDEQS